MEKLLNEFDIYIDKELGKSLNTRLSYMRDLRQAAGWLKEQGTGHISQIGRSELEGYINHLKEENRSASTVSRNIASLKLFFTFAYQKGYIFNNPAEGLKAPKVIRKAPKVVDDDDISKLLGAPDVSTLRGIRDKAMLDLLMSTGMRVSELIGLHRSDINFRKKTVRITGSGDRERSVPVDRDTIRSLTDYDLIARSQMISSKNDDDIFFVSCQGEQMTRQGFWKNLRKYGKEAGLEQEVTPHMLRHSFAVYALKKGADIHVLQNIMGHSDIASTNEYNALL